MIDNLPIIPVFSDGQLDPGNPYVSASRGWFESLHGKTRDKPNVPRFAEWAERFGVILLRNVLNLDSPMRVDQQAALLAAAAADPTNADLQARADIKEFEHAQAEYVAKGVTIYHYVGAVRGFPRQGKETTPVWYHRLRQELRSQLAYSSGVFFDNTMGTHTVYGEWLNAAIKFAIREIQRDGIPVGNEPTNWWHDGDWLGECPKFISRDWLAGREEANLDSALTWLPRKATPTFAGDPSPLQIPGVLGEDVYIWLDFKAPEEKKDPLGNIQRTHERWPHAWLCVPFGWLPKELLD